MSFKSEYLGLAVVTITALLLTYFSITFVLGAPAGASVSIGTQERAPAPPAGSLTTQGGNVTQVNVSGYVVTDKWAGFWGEVSGDIRLADANNYIFYQWTITNVTGGVVYACNNTVSDWSESNIQPLYASDAGWLPSFLLEGTDSFNNTFTSAETFQSPSLSIDSVNYTVTNPTDSNFKTYALRSVADSALIWAGKVVADQTAFNPSNTADYQILAGVDSTTGTTTFYFYLELP